MIERYTRKEMASIWTDETKMKLWLEVEISACEALNKTGLLPDESLKNIKEKAKVDVSAVKKIEEETKHDVAAFVKYLTEQVGDDGKYIHYGLTSSDILDTAFALQLKKSAEIIEEDLKEVMTVIRKKAIEYKKVVIIGRTHGIHAEPTTLGLKFLSWYEEGKRNLERLKRAKEIISYGKISGAVGTYSNIPPEIENYVMDKLGLKVEPVSTQVVPRDRHAEFFTALALIAGFVERIATEIRHLQRTEVLEVEESFGKGQMGSSAMPHKKNPILSENLCGLARLVKATVIPALENIPLWHERDISHSSVERVIAPDATILIDFMLHRLKRVLDELVIHPENMKRNLELTNGLIFSQSVLTELIKKGVHRTEAYRMVQKNAMKCWESGEHFLNLLKRDREVMKHLNEGELEDIFSEERLLKNVDIVFKRVLEE